MENITYTVKIICKHHYLKNCVYAEDGLLISIPYFIGPYLCVKSQLNSKNSKNKKHIFLY